MRRLALILLLVLSYTHLHAEEQKEEFLHPLLYQRLEDMYDGTDYIFTPKTKFFATPLATAESELGIAEVECKLLENKETFVKLLCNDCTNMTCDKHEERINTIEVLYDIPHNELGKYYFKHRIYDKNGERLIRENWLWCHNIVAIKPYQTD